jgi:predicted AAA+ superfamily ATPase
MKHGYLPRIVDKILEDRLDTVGAVLIAGPKWCGKTTMAERQARSVLKLQDPDRTKGYLATADVKPSLLLLGENPRLIDEWQMAPALWDAVRSAVDERGEEGLFILVGSTTVDEEEKRARLREPDLLIVITGGEMAYTRKDGVKIIPVGALKD